MSRVDQELSENNEIMESLQALQAVVSGATGVDEHVSTPQTIQRHAFDHKIKHELTKIKQIADRNHAQ